MTNTNSGPQPGPNEFLSNGKLFYAFFAFDKDPEGTEFWEITQIVDVEGREVSTIPEYEDEAEDFYSRAAALFYPE